jgi:hypothetical protein
MTEQVIPAIQRLPSRAEYTRLLNIQEDQDFVDRYPQGQFLIRRPDSPRFKTVEIFWRWSRRSDWRNPTSLGVSSHETYHTEYRPHVVQHDIGLGKRTYYKTLEALIKASERFGFPSDLVALFVQEYNTKHEQIERKPRVRE